MFIPVTGLPDSLTEYLTSYNDILSKPQQYHFQKLLKIQFGRGHPGHGPTQ